MGRLPVTSVVGLDGSSGPDDRKRIWEDGAEPSIKSQSEEEEEWEPVDMGGFPTGIGLISVCFRGIRKDPELLLYQFLSFALTISVLVVYLAYAIPRDEGESLTDVAQSPVIVLMLFPFYIIAIFIGSYFKAASVACATMRLKGGSPEVADGLALATKNIHKLLGYAVIAAVVAAIVAAMARSRSGAARTTGYLMNLGWSVATYFVIPVLLYEDKGPIDAIPRSASIVKRTWRESLAGNFGIGITFLLFAMFGLFLYPVGYVHGGPIWGIGLVVAYWVGIRVVYSAISAVLVSALFMISKTGHIQGVFEGYVDLEKALSGVRQARRGDTVPTTKEAKTMMLVRR